MGSNPTVTATTKAPNPLETLGCGAFVLSGAAVVVMQAGPGAPEAGDARDARVTRAPGRTSGHRAGRRGCREHVAIGEWAWDGSMTGAHCY